jgi:RND family efflux transporter MFP subunit
VRTPIIGLLLAAVFLLPGCGGDIEPGNTSGQAPLIKGLPLVTLATSPLPGTEVFVGTVESRDRGVISARIAGRVSRVAVREGDKVKKGDLLLLLTDNEAADRLQEARAALAEARGRLASAQARLDLAEKTYKRYQRLFANEAVTPQEMDQVAADLEVARQARASARAAVQRAEGARAAAQMTSSYTRVLAPYDARVVAKEVQEGSTVMPGSPLLTLDRQGPWRVRVEVPESFSGKIAEGDTLSVQIPALGKTLSGKVSEVVPSADPRSRTFQVKVDLGSEPGLSAGLFARISASFGKREALLIPAAALVTRGQLTGVYVVTKGILHYRLVKTGRRVGDRVEILSGLNAGETIVAGDALRARNGARVEG